ncbi:mechanosensitive ion channel family protein [Parvularcula marina]|uniref:Mechanosensitive ion channel protein MscS n=1 Tax=Parvularcula marina TaxID=2292771 RepID=A0A371RIW8_9PROT|nr:mechanosensitive ion channel domain-containing protein [Parvularcula marina]RFB05389.1 mechanosensitive ion channel protein MscS [Parvularcula marina]
MQETDAQTDQTPPPANEADAAPQQAEPVTSDIPGEAAVTPPGQTPPAQGDSGLSEILAVDGLRQRGLELWAWTQENILTLNMLIQLGLLLIAFVPAIIFGPKLKRLIEKHVRHRVPAGILRRACDALATVATLIALWITLGIFMSFVGAMDASNGLLSAAQSLLAAAIFIRLVTLIIRSPFWSKVAFYVAWPIAALDAFGILGDVVAQLEAASLTLAPAEGDNAAVTISMLDIVRAGIIFAIFFWIASFASSLISRQLENVEELNPSFRALLEKILNFALPIIALVIALQMIGFNLASLAVFSGAVGLGIGLGLQKVIGNFLAGFTLLADKSIKPGDTIEVDGVFGWITEMKSRYVAIRTRDGHNILMPNSIFIDEGVVNWSHSDRAVRIHAPFGVTYDQRDLRLVQKLATEAAAEVPRVLETPKPVCNLMEFGDSSVNFDLRFWINDPPNGISNVKSEVMMGIWERLHENGIEIPFPQRDLHIKSSAVTLPTLTEAKVEASE